MGNSPINGGMYLQLEKLDYFAGDTIQGTLNIYLQEDLEAISLNLNFKGFEQCKWWEGGGQHRARFSRKLVTINFQSEIYRWDQGLKQGSYAIPVSFTLPGGLVGSFCKMDSGFRALVKYALSFKLMSSSNQKCECFQDIIIKEMFNPELFQQNLSDEITAKMRTWCCIGRGKCFIKGSIPKNTFYTYEEIHAQIILDTTDSNLSATYTEVSLLQRIHTDSGLHRRDHEFYPVKQQGEGLKVGISQTQFNLSINLHHIQGHLVNQLPCSGTAVRCQYFVKLRAHMNGSCMCCGKLPALEIPIYIISPIIQSPQPPPPPSDWDPQNMDNIAIQYNDRQDSKDLPSKKEDPFFHQD